MCPGRAGSLKIAVILGLAVGISANLGWAASSPGGKPIKPAPACAAIAFRALPGGGADGEQTAGLYKSRLARLELRATVHNGAPSNYYLVANGNRLAGRKPICRRRPRAAPPRRRCRSRRQRQLLARASGFHWWSPTPVIGAMPCSTLPKKLPGHIVAPAISSAASWWVPEAIPGRPADPGG